MGSDSRRHADILLGLVIGLVISVFADLCVALILHKFPLEDLPSRTIDFLLVIVIVIMIGLVAFCIWLAYRLLKEALLMPQG